MIGVSLTQGSVGPYMTMFSHWLCILSMNSSSLLYSEESLLTVMKAWLSCPWQIAIETKFSLKIPNRRRLLHRQLRTIVLKMGGHALEFKNRQTTTKQDGYKDRTEDFLLYKWITWSSDSISSWWQPHTSLH